MRYHYPYYTKCFYTKIRFKTKYNENHQLMINVDDILPIGLSSLRAADLVVEIFNLYIDEDGDWVVCADVDFELHYTRDTFKENELIEVKKGWKKSDWWTQDKEDKLINILMKEMGLDSVKYKNQSYVLRSFDNTKYYIGNEYCWYNGHIQIECYNKYFISDVVLYSANNDPVQKTLIRSASINTLVGNRLIRKYK